MNAWLRHHVYSLRRSLARLASAPLSSSLNVLVISVALALPLGAYALLANMQAAIPAAISRAQVSIFLAPATTPPEAREVEKRLRAHAEVREVRFISKDVALASLVRSAGLGDLMGELRENPLPDAFVVTLASNDGDDAERLAAEARSLRNVAHAQSDVTWVRRLQALMSAGLTAVALLAGVLGLALVAVTFNTVRLQILTQRDEIEVSQLVGATDAYIRRPFLYGGGVQGALGGVAALGIVALSLSILDRDVGRLAELYGASLGLHFFSAGECVAVVALAAFLGWAGAAISVSEHLR